MGNKTGKYDDMIDMKNPTPTCRPRMAMVDRGAQFAPFAALTGYEAVVEEAARLTDSRLELSEDMKTILNDKIQVILENINIEPFVTITYFVPDKRKAGGAYVDVSGIVEKIDEYERCVILKDETKIPIEQIRAIEGEIFNGMDMY